MYAYEDASQGRTTGSIGRRFPKETGFKKTGISLLVAQGALTVDSSRERPEAMESLL